MGNPPLRAIATRRLNITDALKQDIRRRYEQTPESLSGMAADLGCTAQTVCNLAKREGWVRYVAPPREMTPSARLLARAEMVAAAQTDDRHPEVRAAQPRASKGDGQGLQDTGRASFEGGLRPPPQDDGENNVPSLEHIGATAPAPTFADTAEQLHREVQMLLPEVRAARERMKRAGHGKHDLREAAQVIANLSGVLRTLQPMLCSQTGSTDNAYDDMPADLDEFRNDLARRIDALLAEPPDEGDSAQAAGDQAHRPDA